MQTVQFPYRSFTHLPLLHVIAESGSWEKHGLQVDYARPITAREAHDAVFDGSIEFVGGNHISPYGRRARGDNWVYLGQTVNVVPGRKLVVRSDSGICGIADLHEKKVGGKGSHPKLNDWLQLKQHGLDTDRDQVAIVDQIPMQRGGIDFAKADADREAPPIWQAVLDGHVDAAFLESPASLFAQRAGLKLIDIPDLPMIYFTTVSTNSRFVERYPDIVDRFLKGMIESVHFFKTHPEDAKRIIRTRYTLEGTMDAAIAEGTYLDLREVLDARLYPTIEAIANVYAEGVHHDPDASQVNPMELWDLHHIRALSDSGFVDQLYAGGEKK